ncbi:M48 family metallopeptidase [Pigmentiphaga aceris]|uniref:M48 family metallopeptidase n=1 Tax=Pigmentiphaga aceris TaxID=1940612 RepID=A0A5C0AS43_9BURK|nr:M48 family metallopeptidase [Pigmentiphaga aceris]QEI05019.1 M48 family metallopeptidase [Pigmentiphaga aceris]
MSSTPTPGMLAAADHEPGGTGLPPGASANLPPSGLGSAPSGAPPSPPHDLLPNPGGQIEGFYFDGVQSRRHVVIITVGADAISIRGQSVDRTDAWSTCQVSERTRHGPRQIEFSDGARVSIPEPAAFNAALGALGKRDSIAVRMQQSWRIALISLAGCVLAVAAAYQWLLPWAAGVAADQIPRTVLIAVSDQVMETLDKYVMKPSAMPDARQARLRQRLADISQKLGPAELLFRDGGKFGANAFALPSGKIIITDQLAAMLDDEQIVGVLAHELGHVVYRHGMRAVLQNSVVALVAGWYMGDVSSLLAGSAAAYVNLHYSRDFEFEADAYGASLLRANGMSPTLLADALEKLEASHTMRRSKAGASNDAKKGGKPDADEKGSKEDTDYWSTHPGTSDRIKRLLTHEN